MENITVSFQKVLFFLMVMVLLLANKLILSMKDGGGMVSGLVQEDKLILQD
jgi:hypothetical protein